MTSEWREVLLIQNAEFVVGQLDSLRLMGARNELPSMFTFTGVVHGCLWLGVKLTRTVGLAPSWVQLSAAWAAAASSETVKSSSSEILVVVTVGPMVIGDSGIRF